MPYTVASVNNHYSLSIEADENGVFTINYNVNSEPYSLGIITIPSASLTIRDANTVIGGQTDLYVDSTKSGSYSLPVTKGYVYSIVATNEYAIGGSSSNTEHHDASVDFSWGFTSAVSATTTTTTVQADHNPSTYGQPVTFTTTITSSNSASAVPSGTVQFVIDGSNYGNPVPLNNGKAKIVDGALPVSGSPHTVTAVYSGDSIFAGSTGSLPNGQTVQPVSVPTITLTSLHQASIPSTAPGINFTYTVTGSLTAPASINFYWASGNSLDVKTNPDPAYTYSIDTPAREATGTHGTIFIPRADFADVPYGTTYLVATVKNAGVSSTLGVHMFRPVTVDEILQIVPPPTPPTPVKIPPGKLTKHQLARLARQERAYETQRQEYQAKANAYAELSNGIVDYLNSKNAFETYQINYPERQAAFIGQAAVETAYFTTLTQGKTFGVVGKSLGIGRGYLQITGRGNYKAAAAFLGQTVSATLRLLATIPAVAANVSGWYWDGNTGLRGGPVNDSADIWDITAVSQLINAGRINPVDKQGHPVKINGLQQRESYSDHALSVLVGAID